MAEHRDHVHDVDTTRRRFLQLGAAALAATPLSCTRGGGEKSSSEPIIQKSLVAPSAGEGAFELEEMGVRELTAGLESGRWTSRQLVERYLARIEGHDAKGPALHAMIANNPEALAIADALDAERRARGARGPLHGIPVVVKDNLDTADRMPTTAGSLALGGTIAPRDAFVVERLRAAGAVLLGKTNLSEWANFRSTRSSSGWSAVGGQCRNPYALDRNPCGSSSGTGAAIAASYAAAGIGTETDGSIVCPSHACGLVGLKPTVGLVSRAGIVPISHSQDTAGPMARTVADAAALLSAIVGEDPRDPATAAAAGHVEPDYTRFLVPDGMKGARVGIVRDMFGLSPELEATVNAAVDVMKAAGATVVDPAPLPNHEKLGDPELLVLLYEFKADLEAYLAMRGDTVRVRTLADLIAYNQANADREMPHFRQELFVQAQAKGPLTTHEYVKARETCVRFSRAEGIDAALAAHGVDALVAPTGGPAWMTDHVNGDHYTGGSSTPAAVAGYPSLTVPAGFVRGLPVGLTFFGAAWSEPTLIRLAFTYEQATKHRRPPRFPQTSA
jgi:amidase